MSDTLDTLLSETPAMDLGDWTDVSATQKTPALEIAQPDASADETTRILRECDADWTPRAVPAFTAAGHELPGLAMTRDDNNTPIGGVGLVSKNFQGIAPRSVAGPLVESGAEFLGGGSVDNGRIVRIEFSLGDEHHIAHVPVGDIVRARAALLIANDGKGTVRIVLNTLRSQCQNGMVAVQDSVTLRIRHTGEVAQAIADYSEAIPQLMEQWRNTRSVFDILAGAQVTPLGVGAGLTDDDMVRAYVAAIRGRSEMSKQTQKRAGTAERVIGAYHNGAGQEAIRGTAWGLLNAWTNYTSHKPARNGDSQKRALSKVAGPFANDDRKAVTAAYALAKNVPLEKVFDQNSELMRKLRGEVQAGGIVEEMTAGKAPSRLGIG